MSIVAPEAKATKRPSLLMEGARLAPLATETRVVKGVQKKTPAQVSRTKIFDPWFVPPGTMLFAMEVNATKRPSGVIETAPDPDPPSNPEVPLPGVPSGATEMTWVEGVQLDAPRHVSRTTTCRLPPVPRLLASVENAMYLPPWATTASPEKAFAGVPSSATETNCVEGMQLCSSKHVSRKKIFAIKLPAAA